MATLKDKEFILIVNRTHEIFQNRSNKIGHFEDGDIVYDEIIPIPENLILCDGCNSEITTEEVNLVIYQYFLCSGAYCEKCIKEYYSQLPLHKEVLIDV